MAKTLSKINVETGEVVEAHHVSQSIDAFTGTEAYDITLSGSLTVTGSTSLDTLNIQNLGTGSSTVFLGLDSLGNVVTGSTPPTPSEIVEFDTEDPNLGGTVFTPDSQQASNTLYVSTDPDTVGQSWIWNSSTNLYETYEADIPNNTPFWLYGTTIDAGGNKTALIQRNGPIFINSAHSNGSRYAAYLYSRRTTGEGNGLLVRKDLRTTSGNYLLVQGWNSSTNETQDKFKVGHDGKVTSHGVYTPNVQSVVSAATVTPNADTDDEVVVTAQAEALTIANPTGTPSNGQAMIIRLLDNGTARAITFGSEYRAIGVTLPTTTVISKTIYLGIIYNSTDSKWDVIGYNIEA